MRNEMKIDENKLHPIDFEYNHKDNKFIHLVCVAVDNQAFWLNDGSELEDFKKYPSPDFTRKRYIKDIFQ